MRGWTARQIGVVLACAFVLSCSPPSVVQPDVFASWRDADPPRGEAFARFEALLSAEGVSGVVPNYELWLVDQLRPECSRGTFLAPPEDQWRNILPTLRFIRDHVEPAVGEVRVVSAYRDEAFNACVGGAPQSAHRSYYALDLVPIDAAIYRDELISKLCPIHATEGRRARRVGHLSSAALPYRRARISRLGQRPSRGYVPLC
jgi:hypothetical protein